MTSGLLSQPGGLEGLFEGRVYLATLDQPVLDCVEERRPQVDPRVAAPQPRSLERGYNDLVLARVDAALDLVGPLFIRTGPLSEELHEGIASAELRFSGPCGPRSDVPDKIRRDQVRQLLCLVELSQHAP